MENRENNNRELHEYLTRRDQAMESISRLGDGFNIIRFVMDHNSEDIKKFLTDKDNELNEGEKEFLISTLEIRRIDPKRERNVGKF